MMADGGFENNANDLMCWREENLIKEMNSITSCWMAD